MAGMAEGMTIAIDGAILAAPAVWGRRTMPEIQAWFLDLFAHVMPAVAGKNQGLDFTPSDNIEMLRGLGRDPLVIKETRIDAIYGLVNLMDQALAAAPSLRAPTLILLGARDDIIESGPSCAMLRDLPSGAARAWRAALYPRGYHMLLRDLQAETVLADVAAWMTARTAPLPSGAELPPDRIDTACRSR
ncbi:MAG: alpha/beta hydrolase [Alphaproteobacteria bacterium]|nr:alpha/beta hydrolase [Alphaproteobacteria bacterium]